MSSPEATGSDPAQFTWSPEDVKQYCAPSCPEQTDSIKYETELRRDYAAEADLAAAYLMSGQLERDVTTEMQRQGITQAAGLEIRLRYMVRTNFMLEALSNRIQSVQQRRCRLAEFCVGPRPEVIMVAGQARTEPVCTSTAL